MKLNFKQQNGYVLLLAVILVSIILSMTIGIANVSLKQLYFTKTAKESHLAFFVADTGGECALYHYKYGTGVFDGNPATFDCGGNNFSITPDPLTGAYNFKIDSGKACADVTVSTDAVGNTLIQSKGYNVTCSVLSTNPNQPRQVERTLEYCFEATPGSCVSSSSSYLPGLTSGSGLVGTMPIGTTSVVTPRRLSQ
jgi:hypothetical protein